MKTITVLRTRKNMTQTELAAASKTHQSEISRIERGHVEAPDKLARIAAVLDVDDPIDLLLDYEDYVEERGE